MSYYSETIKETMSSRIFAEVFRGSVRVYVIWNSGAIASAVVPNKKVTEDVQFTDEFSGKDVWNFTADEFNALLERAENGTVKLLRVTHFQNGEEIPRVEDNEKWSQLKSAAYCVNEQGDFLYNQYALNDPRGLIPEGWDIY